MSEDETPDDGPRRELTVELDDSTAFLYEELLAREGIDESDIRPILTDAVSNQVRALFNQRRQIAARAQAAQGGPGPRGPPAESALAREDGEDDEREPARTRDDVEAMRDDEGGEPEGRTGGDQDPAEVPAEPDRGAAQGDGGRRGNTDERDSRTRGHRSE